MMFISPLFLHDSFLWTCLSNPHFIPSYHPIHNSHKLVKSLLLRDVTELGEILVPSYSKMFFFELQ